MSLFCFVLFFEKLKKFSFPSQGLQRLFGPKGPQLEDVMKSSILIGQLEASQVPRAPPAADRI
jgi:hypothetical protein